MQSYICFDILIEFHFHFAIGKQWYYGFLRRHQELTLRKPSPLGQQRAAVTTDQMQRWYQELLQYLTDTGKLDVLSSPERILNCDESGFPLCTTSGRVLAERGKKNVYQRVTNSRQQITVLACMSASGMYLPPYIIYPGKRIRNVDIEDFPEALYGTSDSGWMTGDLFYDFLKVVSGKMEDANIQHPVLLLVDGHASHVTLRAAQFCEEKDIILYSLYPHASHIHQPCDLALFGPMKQVWKEEVHKWQLEHLGESFAKKSFPTVFKKTWQKTAIPENAIKGFQKAGIYPFNPAAIDLTRLVTHLATTSQQSAVPLATTSQQSAVPLATTSQQQAVPLATTSQQQAVPLATTSQQSAVPLATTSQQSAVPLATTSQQSAVPLATTSQQQAVPLATTSQQPTFAPLATTSQQTATSSFMRLSVPKKSQTSKSKRQCMSVVLPNAISGQDAIHILNEKEKEKERLMREKEDRKIERLRKKQEREEAAKKRKEEAARRKEEAGKKKAEKQKIAEERKQQKLKNSRKRTVTSSSDSESGEFTVNYMDSDEETEETEENAGVCFTCKGSDGQATEWVGCDICPRWYHLCCSGDANLEEMSLTDEQLERYVFVCPTCAGL